MPEKTKRTLVFLLIGLSIWVFARTPSQPHRRIEKVISKIVSGNLSFSRQKPSLSPEYLQKLDRKFKSRLSGDQIDLWIISENNIIRSYALTAEVYGKTLPFSFLVIFDPRAMIQAVRILRYREEYGHEVKNKKWLELFKNRNFVMTTPGESGLDGISGATISSHSLIKGVEQLSYILYYWLRSNGNGQDQSGQKQG